MEFTQNYEACFFRLDLLFIAFGHESGTDIAYFKLLIKLTLSKLD